MSRKFSETESTFEAFTKRKGKPAAAKFSKVDNRRNFNKLRQIKREA